jgi:hypothetical protein
MHKAELLDHISVEDFLLPSLLIAKNPERAITRSTAKNRSRGPNSDQLLSPSANEKCVYIHHVGRGETVALVGIRSDRLNEVFGERYLVLANQFWHLAMLKFRLCR